jgi:hypothetical protein
MTEYTLTEGQQSVAPAQEEPTRGSGYISTSYYGQQEQAVQQEQASVNADQALINELSAKLGIPADVQGQTQEQPQTQEEKDEFLQKLGTEEGKQLVEQFKKVTGIDLQEAFGIVQNTAKLTQELDAWRNQIVRDRQVEELRKEWGGEFDVIMPDVIEAFKKLPPNMQQALDNPDGARLLAAQLRQQKRYPTGGNASSQYVNQGHVRQASSGGTVAPQIRMSEMIKWSGQELDRRMPDVLRAKAAGTLIHDI